MPSEDSAQKSRDQCFGQGGPDNTGAQHQHVHIIVFHSLPGGVGIMTDACPDSRQFVGRDGRSDAAAAQDNASSRVARSYRPADRHGVVHVIVAWSELTRPNVKHFVAEPTHKLREGSLQRVASVIGAQGDSHGTLTTFPSMLPAIMGASRVVLLDLSLELHIHDSVCQAVVRAARRGSVPSRPIVGWRESNAPPRAKAVFRHRARSIR